MVFELLTARGKIFVKWDFWRRCNGASLVNVRRCWQSFAFWYGMRTCVPETGSWFNIKMSSYQYRKSHCGDKTIVRSSDLPNGISYTGKMTSLYWFSPQVSNAGTSIVVCNHFSLPLIAVYISVQILPNPITSMFYSLVFTIPFSEDKHMIYLWICMNS